MSKNGPVSYPDDEDDYDYQFNIDDIIVPKREMWGKSYNGVVCAEGKKFRVLRLNPRTRTGIHIEAVDEKIEITDINFFRPGCWMPYKKKAIGMFTLDAI